MKKKNKRVLFQICEKQLRLPMWGVYYQLLLNDIEVWSKAVKIVFRAAVTLFCFILTQYEK